MARHIPRNDREADKRMHTYWTHPGKQQWADACRMIDARQKQAQRRLGIYDPVNGKNYPYPEDGMLDRMAEVSRHFQAIRERAYQRLVKDTPPYMRYGLE